LIYSGQAVGVNLLDEGIAELCFDLHGESVNKFNQLTLKELGEAIASIKDEVAIQAVMVTSGKPTFIVGADIDEFGELFRLEEELFTAKLLEVNTTVFSAFEDLPLPTVAAINGFALGGGLEMALTADYRIMSNAAKIGLPETTLGIIPGYGGTVRLPRLIGPDNAIEWLASGLRYDAEIALKFGVVDAVVAPEDLREAAFSLLQECLAGRMNYHSRKREKLEPIRLSDIEARMTFETARAAVERQAGEHNPAPLVAVDTIERSAFLQRDEALLLEARANAKLARSPVAKNLIGLFQGEQILLKDAGDLAKAAAPVKKCAVLGAGLMGGGIACQTALKGMPVIMKDIGQSGIKLGLTEASRLLSGKVHRGRMEPEDMAAALNRIRPSLSFEGFDEVDLVVEAVIENLHVKQSVLSETETCLGEDAILASNTSTISITQLGSALQKPERFCGMHFFNPVHWMPLVEVIRGELTGDQAVARAVGFALTLGKKPVVVNDCPGFLVNRILAPYLNAFLKLVSRGVDFHRIDKAMEKFGWPMGPAYLCDVIGLDTLKHGEKVLAEGYPDRMSVDFTSSHDILLGAGRLGQKGGRGYYIYEPDKRGRLKKIIDPEVGKLLTTQFGSDADIRDVQIVEHLMLPMCLEAVRCLEEGIAASANDIDLALIYGLGFPSFRGGALRYLDDLGLDESLRAADQYAELDSSYRAPEMMRQMTARGDRFYI
jgi:3-hydroxyacyl-CoA dehydrogenase/enoyl-CoA hydratase/3-hydroxybutyryl-CoA epimerase/enoyl-CoA isomerase